MGVFSSSRFSAPNLDYSNDPSLDDLFDYKDRQKRNDLNYQEELMNFGSKLRFNELAKTMALNEQYNPKPSYAERFHPHNTTTPPTQQRQVFLNNPSFIDPYKRGQLDLGKEKLDITRDNNEERNKILQQQANTKSDLASLHDLSDSEKMELLQNGKVTLQQLKDAAAASRVTQKGDITTKQIDQKGKITSDQIEQKGDITSRQIGEKGDQARETKGTPSADAGITAQLPTQQLKALQIRANQAKQDHPEWNNWISIDQNGLVQLEPPGETWHDFGKPTQKEHDAIVAYLRGNSDKPAAGGANPADYTPPAGAATDTTKSTKPNTATTGGMIEMTTPDGKSTRMVPADQVETAKKQGYKTKGG